MMKTLPDYSLLVLSDYEQSLFDRFKDSENASVTLTREEFKVLSKKGLVSGTMSGKSDWFDGLPENGVCTLSDFGKGFCAYQIKQAREQRKKEKSDFRKEVRSWITLAIAVLGFVLSVISISWQIYTWRSERAEYLQSQTAAYTETDNPGFPTDQ